MNTGRVNGINVKYNVTKKADSKLMVFISYLLFWQRKTFMENYYTTIGRTIYTPCEIKDASLQVLEHELVHVFDYQQNPVWFTVSYLLFLPLGWTMRAHWEKRAYSWNIGRHGWTDPQWVVDNFCTSRYLWMWPNEKAVRKWVEDCANGTYAPIKEVVL